MIQNLPILSNQISNKTSVTPDSESTLPTSLWFTQGHIRPKHLLQLKNHGELLSILVSSSHFCRCHRRLCCIPGSSSDLSSVRLGLRRLSRFQPHPPFFQQGQNHAYCGKQKLLDRGLAIARIRSWNSTGFLGTVCSHVMKWSLRPACSLTILGVSLLVRKMRHLPNVFWAPIQTSHIHTSRQWPAVGTAERRNIFTLGLYTAKPRDPYWWKHPRSLKTVWGMQYPWQYLVPNCVRLWRSSQCFSNCSWKAASIDVENGFRITLKGCSKQIPPPRSASCFLFNRPCSGCSYAIGGLVLHHPVGNSPIQDGSQHSAMHWPWEGSGLVQ